MTERDRAMTGEEAYCVFWLAYGADSGHSERSLRDLFDKSEDAHKVAWSALAAEVSRRAIEGYAIISDERQRAAAEEHGNLRRQMCDYFDQLQAERAKVAKLREGLEKCGVWFADYAEQHRNKGTEDGDRKAETNEARAAHCFVLLAEVDLS